MTRRLYVDVTRTAREQTYTGIQKVVRTTFRALSTYADQHGCEVVAIAIDSRGAYRLGELALHPYEKAATKAWLDSALKRLRRFADAHPDTLMRKASRLMLRRISSLQWHGRRLTAAVKRRNYVTFERDDILLLPDSAWADNPWSVVADLKARGGMLAAICYDLIPVTHPHFFSQTLVASFKTYLERMIASADCVACISQSVQRDLEAFAGAEGRQIHVETVYPIVRISQPASVPRCDLDDALKRPTLLIVATIEPRKGHELLLNACDALWAEGWDFNFIIIGRIGWQVEGLMQRFTNHTRRGSRLFLFHDASDADVAFAFQRALLLVFPSAAEGLGLPILEAEMAGCPTLCSDIPVFREIASPLTKFFSPYSASGLTEALRTALSDGWVRGSPPATASSIEERTEIYARRLFDVLLTRQRSLVPGSSGHLVQLPLSHEASGGTPKPTPDSVNHSGP